MTLFEEKTIQHLRLINIGVILCAIMLLILIFNLKT